MFSKLHNDKKQPKNKSYQQTYNEKLANHQKYTNKSYSKLHHKKKEIQTGVYVHNLLQSETFIFEGVCNHEIKNGEGVMLLKNGTCIIGKWIDDILNGRAVIFSPFGGIISAEFAEGKLNGWAIANYQNEVIVSTMYFEDKIDSQRILFEQDESLWVASKYTPEGKFLKIVHVEKGMKNQLPFFVDNQELQMLYHQVVVERNLLMNMKTISSVQILNNMTFLGFLNEDLPSGLGVVFSNQELFVGNFNAGFLHNFGRMVFKNGEIYHGFTKNGAFHKEGIYYSPIKNQTVLLNSNETEASQIIESFQGYILLDFNPQISMKTMNSSPGFALNAGINGIIECIEKYYTQYYLQKKTKMEQEYSIRSIANSSDADIQNNQQPQQILENIPIKINSIPKKMWINTEDQNLGCSDYDYGSEPKTSPLQISKSKFPSFQEDNSEKIRSFKKEEYISDDDRFRSMAIKQNQNIDQQESFQKKPPKFLKKKSMFKNEASKSVDILDPQFAIHPVEISHRNSKKISPRHKGPTSSNNTMSQQMAKNSESRNSSSISNISSKMMAIMKKSITKRKRIFD